MRRNWATKNAGGSAGRVAPVSGPAVSTTLNAAMGWYVALRSRRLRRSPVRVDLLGRPYVAWRGPGGRPALMHAHCPHMGAALFTGDVVDGTLRCPFHHWRFDADGRCSELPSGRRPPAAARIPVVATTERDGYVWFWHGTPEPLYPLPAAPGAGASPGPAHRVFRLEDPAGTTVRRVLENSFDPDHLVALHGLDVRGATAAEFLDADRADEEFGVVPRPDARLCAVFSWPSYDGWLGRLSGALDLNAEHFELRVAAWPSLQHLEYRGDGQILYRLVLAVTPVAVDRSVQHIAVTVVRRGRSVQEASRYLMHRAEITVAARQDLPVFDTMRSGDRHGIYVSSDRPVREFRRFYQAWTPDVGPE